MKTTISRTASAVLFFIVSVVGVAAQPARKELTPNPLIRIIRYEDQRNWNDDLKMLLSGAEPMVRKRAALAAGRIGDARAIPTLADMVLMDRDKDVRQMAAFALGEIELPGGAYALTQVLKGSGSELADANVRARAVEALGKIVAAMPNSGASAPGTAKPPEDERLNIIKAAIVDTLRFEEGRRSQPDRLTILLALTAVLRSKPEGVGPLVAKFLDYSDPEIVATALNTMARLRLKDANERVRELLNHSDPIVRANAARVVGAAEDKGGLDALLDRAVHDRDLRVSVSAIRALGSLKDKRAVQPLLDRGTLLSTAAGYTQISGLNHEAIGIPECDNFLAEFEACISQIPGPARDNFRFSLDQVRSAWKKLVDNSQTKLTLSSACKQTSEMQRVN